MTSPWPFARSSGPRLGLVPGLALTALVAVIAWVSPEPVLRFEQALLDFRYKLRGERPVGSEIVLVVVDELSLREIGRWPWPRDIQAQLVDAIAAQVPRVIGLDILYMEPDGTRAGSAATQGALAQDTVPGSRSPASHRPHGRVLSKRDRLLASSLERARRVVLPFALVVPKSSAPWPQADRRRGDAALLETSQFMVVKQASSRPHFQPYRAAAALAPLPAFVSTVAALGHVYSPPDLDGVTRHEYMAVRFGDAYYPSFALEVARVFADVPRHHMSLTLGGGVSLGDRLVPTDQKGRMLIDYPGPGGSFPSVPATDVLKRRITPGTFTGKIVLVGTTALGTYDQKSTPFSTHLPGVEKNAAVVDSLIHGRFITSGLWSTPLELGAILFFGSTLTIGLRRLGALHGAALAAALYFGYGAVAVALFSAHGLWIPAFTPLLALLVVFVAVTLQNYLTKERQARMIREMFSSYVNPRIVDELVKSPSRATLGGQRKELTMLFADLTDFTGFAERYPAEQVVAQLNEYLQAMVEVAFCWNGTVDKFVGDELVVFWGAPLDQPDHVELAVKCALHMRKRLHELHAKWTAEGKVVLDNGIGINTGIALVGNIGAEGRKMDYTMIGDQVNLAARIQKLTRHFSCPIVITESTAERISALMQVPDSPGNHGRIGHVLLRNLGVVRVRGRETPVKAYSVQSLPRDESSRGEEGAGP